MEDIFKEKQELSKPTLWSYDQLKRNLRVAILEQQNVSTIEQFLLCDGKTKEPI